MNKRIVATQSTLTTLTESEMKEEERILLKVQGRNGADQLCYWMGRKTRLHHLIVDYTQRVNVKFNSMIFLYNGSIINPYRTADDLKMKDGDIVGVKATVPAIQSTLISLYGQKDEKPVLIPVLDQKNSGYIYRMGRNTPLQNLMLDFCDRKNITYGNMKFIYKGGFISPDQTADDLKMQDEDLIRAVIFFWGRT